MARPALLRTLVDPERPGSLSGRSRRRRFRAFAARVETLPRPLRILDVGGSSGFWRLMGFADQPGVTIVLLNQYHVDTSNAGETVFESLLGDARDMGEFGDGSFDVAFSNSVIEHVGERSDQQRMAAEVRRVAKRYWVQTPNRRFPIEPHFLFPWFQYLPERAQLALVRRVRLGWMPRVPDPDEARAAVRSVRLLDAAEMAQLFPGATIHRERLLGLTKSVTAAGGW